jgi:hypothetical protein
MATAFWKIWIVAKAEEKAMPFLKVLWPAWIVTLNTLPLSLTQK